MDVLKPHLVMVPFPSAGHINPLMQLGTHLASNGCAITFVNTQYNHERILEFNRTQLPNDNGLDVRLVGIPPSVDDNCTDNDLTNLFRTVENISSALEDLITTLNQEGTPVTCIISDVSAVKTLDVAKKFGIPRVAFAPPAIASYAVICHASDGIGKHTFPENGLPELHEMICFPGVPPVAGSKLPWMFGTKHNSASLFQSCIRYLEALRESAWILCNSVFELEAQTLQLLPQGFPGLVCPVGPLLPSSFLERNYSRGNRITTNLWPEDDECLEWLDSQATASVLYVSVGSLAILDKQQFEELAYGLEASHQPSLWVIRPDITGENFAFLPEGFVERTAKRVRIVSWAPQLLVLSHRAIGGFLTHCGWNSTMESMSTAVPMLAWPHLMDQHINAKLVVDKWRVALALDVEEKGFVGRATVEEQARRLMGEEEGKAVRARASRLRETIVVATREGGSSYNSLQAFVKWVKQQT